MFNRKFLQLALIVSTALPLAAQQVSSTVSEWYGGAPGVSPKTRGLSGVTVLAGPNLNFNTGQGGSDVVSGGVSAKGSTDERGNYTLNLPAGKYVILYWKEGYTPQTDSVVSPGTNDSSISVDKSMQGLHRSLQFR